MEAVRFSTEDVTKSTSDEIAELAEDGGDTGAVLEACEEDFSAISIDSGAEDKVFAEVPFEE